MNNRKSIELLSPAGDTERLDAALLYGADAVYLAGSEFGMRSGAPNFTNEQLASAAKKIHSLGKKVYVTCNVLPHNRELDALPQFLRFCNDISIDALIVTDWGVIELAKKYAPNVDLHISTQMGVVNYESARMLHSMGASRVVLARELSLAEIAEIRAKTPQDLEIEAFVHGAMCVSFSGRCLLSSYLTGRDSNRGDCAQPCRWKYNVVEEKRPGKYMPIEENSQGTFLFNSHDMCMISHIPELIDAGITSLKIEGRAKSAYYVAVVTNAYRRALDHALQNPGQPLPEWVLQETDKISHREYSTGFYYNREPGQNTDSSAYVRHYEVAAIGTGRTSNGLAVLSQRNRFFKGDVLDVLCPNEEPFTFVADEIFEENGTPIEVANRATMTVLVRAPREIPEGAYLRRKI